MNIYELTCTGSGLMETTFCGGSTTVTNFSTLVGALVFFLASVLTFLKQIQQNKSENPEM